MCFKVYRVAFEACRMISKVPAETCKLLGRRKCFQGSFKGFTKDFKSLLGGFKDLRRVLKLSVRFLKVLVDAFFQNF